jgi:hypothetical protein
VWHSPGPRLALWCAGVEAPPAVLGGRAALQRREKMTEKIFLAPQVPGGQVRASRGGVDARTTTSRVAQPGVEAPPAVLGGRTAL